MRDRIKKIFINILIFLVRVFVTGKRLPDFKTVLILAPHPDDEIFGLGGIILQTLQKGGKVNLVYLTDGEASGVCPDKEEIRIQKIALSEQVCKKLGLDSSTITRLHLSDGAVPHLGQTGFPEAVIQIKGFIESLKPDAVFATHPLDYWPFDHVACAHIAKEAVNKSKHKTQLWYYWVWAWYNIRPWQLLKIRYRKLQKIDISEQIPQKKTLTDIYLKAFTPEGKSWSGILPQLLIKAIGSPFEVCEKVDIT